MTKPAKGGAALGGFAVLMLGGELRDVVVQAAPPDALVSAAGRVWRHLAAGYILSISRAGNKAQYARLKACNEHAGIVNLIIIAEIILTETRTSGNLLGGDLAGG